MIGYLVLTTTVAEFAAYKAVAAEVCLESPVTATEFWFVSSDRFPTLSSDVTIFVSAFEQRGSRAKCQPVHSCHVKV